MRFAMLLTEADTKTMFSRQYCILSMTQKKLFTS